MKYNTAEKRLILPEYGRNIQNMVDYCLTLEDRGERNRCAASIINLMGNMFPHLRDVNDFKHILWDHLAIMADFRLDVDYPYDIIKKENLYRRPPRLPYSNSRFRYRHYGLLLEEMLQKASSLPEGPEKEALIRMLANHMKRQFLLWNKDTVENGKILSDLSDLSNGHINRDEESCKLLDAREIHQKSVVNINLRKSYSRKK